MLEKAEGANCQASNFLKAFTAIAERASSPESSCAGLTCMIGSKSEVLEEKSRTSPLSLKIQTASRLLLENISADLPVQNYPHVVEFDHVW